MIVKSLFLLGLSCHALALTPLPEPVIKERALAALVGGLLSDAAAMPLHWIYSTAEIKQLVGSGVPEFYKTPSCPFYKYQKGDSTPYGQQFQAYLQVGASSKTMKPTDVETAYASLYANAPSYWYKDESTKEFLANEANGQHYPSCGGNDNQADAMVHALPVVALLCGKNTSAMLAAADAVIRVTQNTDEGAAFGLASARILEYIIAYNITGVAAVTQAIADMKDPNRAMPYSVDADLASRLQDAIDHQSESNFDYVQKIGQSCDYPNNLQTGAHLIMQLANRYTDPESYIDGTRQTIMAGGDSGSRGFFVGAAQAATLGSVSSLPQSWFSQSNEYPTASANAARLVANR
jgi:ADP-ribosylglycohydrolase